MTRTVTMTILSKTDGANSFKILLALKSALSCSVMNGGQGSWDFFRPEEK